MRNRKDWSPGIGGSSSVFWPRKRGGKKAPDSFIRWRRPVEANSLQKERFKENGVGSEKSRQKRATSSGNERDSVHASADNEQRGNRSTRKTRLHTRSQKPNFNPPERRANDNRWDKKPLESADKPIDNLQPPPNQISPKKGAAPGAGQKPEDSLGESRHRAKPWRRFIII
uniref:Uncharacterized protein n=1 Tax=Steinernema glaseri TaxID=37863 RepID=A0A1I8A484_9BILA